MLSRSGVSVVPVGRPMTPASSIIAVDPRDGGRVSRRQRTHLLENDEKLALIRLVESRVVVAVSRRIDDSHAVKNELGRRRAEDALEVEKRQERVEQAARLGAVAGGEPFVELHMPGGELARRHAAGGSARQLVENEAAAGAA